MSVINQMLIDLEKRKNSSNRGSVLSGVSVSYENHSQRRRWNVLFGVFVVLIACYAVVNQKKAESFSVSSDYSAAAPSPVKKLSEASVVDESTENKAETGTSSDKVNMESVNVAAVEPVETVPEKESPANESDVNNHVKHMAEPDEIVIIADARPATKPNPKPVTVPESRTVPRKKVVVAARTKSSSPVRKELSAKDKAQFLYQRALGLLKDGRVEPAISDFRNVLTLDAGLVSAREMLSGLLIDSGRYDEAHAVLKKGISQNADNPVLAKLYAKVLIEEKNLSAAFQVLKRAEQNAMSDADYMALLAVVSQRIGLHEEAVFYYVSALDINDAQGVWWMGMGISLDAMHKSMEAVRAFKMAKNSGQLNSELMEYIDGRLRDLAV